MTAGDSPKNKQMTTDSQSILSITGCLKVICVLVLLLIVMLIALFALAREIVEQLIDGIGQGLEDLGKSVAAIPQSVSDAVSNALRNETRARFETEVELAKSLNAMGMLVTASHSGDAVVHAGISSYVIFNACGLSINHRAEGTVEAGVDFSQASASDFSYDRDKDTWTLTLGKGRIHSCRIDFSKQQSHSISLCRQEWENLRLLAESEAMSEILNEALAEGLLTSAERVASQVLENFLGALPGINEVRVAFDPAGPEPDLPESCLREPPPGWTFDEESDTWKRE